MKLYSVFGLPNVTRTHIFPLGEGGFIRLSYRQCDVYLLEDSFDMFILEGLGATLGRGA